MRSDGTSADSAFLAVARPSTRFRSTGISWPLQLTGMNPLGVCASGPLIRLAPWKPSGDLAGQASSDMGSALVLRLSWVPYSVALLTLADTCGAAPKVSGITAEALSTVVVTDNCT